MAGRDARLVRSVATEGLVNGFRFIHAADLHLDSPLVNVDRYDGAPVEELRGATRRALRNLVDLAIREEVGFVLIAGDLFDGDCRDLNTPIFLRDRMAELADAGIRVYIAQGNHDAQTRMKKAFRLQLPQNVHVFETRRAETRFLEDLQVAIHGQGFAQAAVNEDLSASYPEARRGWLNVGVLHTTVGGYGGNDSYAPSTVDGLSAKGYDYWALGHVHTRTVIRRSSPWIVYPGCIQGRHVNEPGEKGCTLVTVEDGEVVEPRHCALDVVRWTHCAVDATGCRTTDEVLPKLQAALTDRLDDAGDRLLVARIEIEGACGAHGQLVRDPEEAHRAVRELATDRFGDRVWVESVRLLTRPAIDLEALMDRGDTLAELLRALVQPEGIRDAVAASRADLEAVLQKIPHDGRLPDAPFDLDSEVDLARLADDVRRLLVPLLVAGRESP